MFWKFVICQNFICEKTGRDRENLISKICGEIHYQPKIFRQNQNKNPTNGLEVYKPSNYYAENTCPKCLRFYTLYKTVRKRTTQFSRNLV